MYLLNSFLPVAELCVKIEAVRKNNEDGKRGAKVNNFFVDKIWNHIYKLYEPGIDEENCSKVFGYSYSPG